MRRASLSLSVILFTHENFYATVGSTWKEERKEGKKEEMIERQRKGTEWTGSVDETGRGRRDSARREERDTPFGNKTT